MDEELKNGVPVCFRELDDPTGVFQARGERLVDEHALARLQNGRHLSQMGASVNTYQQYNVDLRKQRIDALDDLDAELLMCWSSRTLQHDWRSPGYPGCRL